MPVKLKVIIVGAGISALTLSLLLETCGIDYILLEKQGSFKPPARCCVLGAVILPLIEQLGLLEQVMDISLPVRKFHLVRHDKTDSAYGSMDLDYLEERYGYKSRILPRPAFYNILLSRIPREKILLGKRVLSTSQSENGVLVRCADGSTFSGDILVGADGGMSAVRQNLYRQIDAQSRLTTTSSLGATPLPTKASAQDGKNDHGETGWTLLGITDPLDPTQYPEVARPYSDFSIVLGNKNKVSLWLMPTIHRRLQWVITAPIEQSSMDDSFKSSEPGLEAMEAMCTKYNDLLCPYGGTMKDIFDKSPRPLMALRLIQEKVWDIWHEGRTALVGNACHKVHRQSGLNDSPKEQFLPQSAGQIDGINMADAVSLANVLYDLQSNTLSEISAAFAKYYEQRQSYAAQALHLSKDLHDFFTAKGLFADLSRKLVLHRSAQVIWRKKNDSAHQDRPQSIFLPMVPHKGHYRRQDPVVSSLLVQPANHPAAV